MPMLPIQDARELVEGCMLATHHSPEEAEIIADHIIDCALRGLTFGGLPRVLPVVARLDAMSEERRPIQIVHETPVSAKIDGGDQLGFLVARRATEIAIEKAAKQGIAVVGVHNTWITGMFSYYLEMVTAAGYIGFGSSSSMPTVAPHGGTEARFGTNPVGFGFPSTDGAIILDAGTANIMYGEVVLRQRNGESLPEGAAFGPDGEATQDPSAALAGALTVWGGHKGSGLATCVQLLGMLAGATPDSTNMPDAGFFLTVVDPEVLGDRDFPKRVAEYAKSIRSTRPIDPDRPVRVPFDRSASTRREAITRGTLEVTEPLLEALERIRSRRATDKTTTTVS